MEILDIEEVHTAPKTELAPIERAAIALESSKTEQHLMALATKHQSITVVKDKAGREQAHGAYIEVMRARTAVEKAAKDAREDATKFSKAVIAEAARLVAIVEPEEAKSKPAEPIFHARAATEPLPPVVTEAAPVVTETAPVAAAAVQCDGQCGDAETVHTHLPTAPVASAIVLAVAESWRTDNKTAARWITERAAEIESLQ